MSDENVKLEYDEEARRATLTFKTGRTLAISNVSREQADKFFQKNAAEFARRDGCLETPAVEMVR